MSLLQDDSAVKTFVATEPSAPISLRFKQGITIYLVLATERERESDESEANVNIQCCSKRQHVRMVKVRRKANKQAVE